MVRLETIEFIKVLISSFIGYIPVVTFVGFCSTLIAKKLGDTNPEDEGLLTLNPFVHVDFIGLAFILIPPYIGFARGVQLNPDNIHGRYKNLRIFILFFANVISNFISLILSLLLATLFLTFFSKILTGNVNELSSLSLSILLIFRAMIGFSCFSMIINFISSTISSVVYFFFPEYRENPSYIYALFLLPILIFILFSNSFDYIFNFVIINISKFLNYFIH